MQQAVSTGTPDAVRICISSELGICTLFFSNFSLIGIVVWIGFLNLVPRRNFRIGIFSGKQGARGRGFGLVGHVRSKQRIPTHHSLVWDKGS